MLHKMGWTEGKGLGKEEQGINTHIVAKKRKDEEGLGQEGVLAAEMGDQWWAGSLEKTMYKMKMKKKLAKQAKKAEKKAAATEVRLRSAVVGKVYCTTSTNTNTRAQHTGRWR